MPHVLVDGVRIHYETHGQGFPLILCYCRGGNTTMWRRQIPEFSRSYRLILWDPRGHGQSDSPKDPQKYGLDNSVQDLLAVLDHLGIEKPYVGGLSMGGGISTRFALEHPERVAALLILDSGSAAGQPSAQANQAPSPSETANEIALAKGMEAFGRYNVENSPAFMGRAKRGPEAVQELMEMFMALDSVGYVNAVRAADKAPPIAHRLSEITAPTLVLAGDEDPALESCRFAHSQIKGSQFVLVPNAGHFTNLDQTEVFNREVLGFLSRVDAKRLALR